MTAGLPGLSLDELLLVHAAPIEGHGLEDLGAQAIGVGKVAATANLTMLLGRREHVAAVLLFGVAGAFPDRHRERPSGLSIGDVVVVERDQLGDEGVATPDGFLDLGSMQLGDCGPFPADPRLTAAAAATLGARHVGGVTVSSCSGTEAASAEIRARSSADVETMEGAAVAFVCRRFEIPLLHLRTISNWTGDRGRGAWSLGPAVDALQAAVRTLLHA